MKEESKSEPQLSLDDVAALLVQVELTNLSDLGCVREALAALVSQESPSSLVHGLISDALQKIDELANQTTSDPNAVLADVGRLLDIAADSMEEGKSGQAPQAAPKQPEPPSPPVKEESAETGPKRSPSPEASHEDAPPVTEAPAQTEQDDWPEQLIEGSDLSLTGDFVTESRECIEGAEAALLSLEGDPENLEDVNTVFRAFHTIKGTSAFLGLEKISGLAHLAESLLSRVRDREIRCAGGYADLALRSVDMLKEILQTVQDVLGGQPMAKPEGYDELMGVLTDPEGAGISEEADQTGGVSPRLGDILVAEGKAERGEVEAAAAYQGKQPIGVALVKSGAAALTDVAQALRKQRRASGSEHVMESSVRVRTDRLDRLINNVGELVIAQSMVAQDNVVGHRSNYDLLRKVAHAGKIIHELQDLSMSMRMVPLKATFQKMTRLVRDLARKNGKLVELVTEGEETEIDRNMVDIINDPLVHMVRNAVDHGIEMPEVRQAAGKHQAGTVLLRAYYSGGNVMVELRDDGKGLDRERIVKKAISKGLIESDKTISDSEAFNLIFMPGFSTAEKVTEVSGRGVGLDVVKRNVEALRGRVDISSEFGKGCSFTLRLPLTLAITDGMLVKVGGERFIVPTVNIYMNFRPEASNLSTVAGRGEMVMLRGELMPMYRLHRLFNIKGAIEDPKKALLVIVGDGDLRCALLIDELLGQQQVVAKSLGDGIGKIQGVSGGAILGDGRVGLILDPAEVADLARQAPGTGNQSALRARQASGKEAA